MNGYMVVIVGIAVLFAALITLFIIIAVIKGFCAGETVVEIRILGIIHFRIRLSEVSRKQVLPTTDKTNKDVISIHN